MLPTIIQIEHGLSNGELVVVTLGLWAMCWLPFAERLPYSFRQTLVASFAHPSGKRLIFLFGLSFVSCPPVGRLGYVFAFVHFDLVKFQVHG